MKKSIVYILSVISLAFSVVSCEAEADASDFVTIGEVNDIINDELGVLDTPVFITEISGADFTAVSQTATIVDNVLTLRFVSEVDDILLITVENPESIIYSAEAGSDNLFVVEYIIRNNGGTFTTSSAVSDSALGELDLFIVESEVEETLYSGIFTFTAFNEDGSTAISTFGEFVDVN